MREKIAIIVAAGKGTRFGGKKQFIEIDGKPLYYYSIKAFEGIADKIILVVPKEDVDEVEPYGSIVVAGGENRYDSVYEGLKLCSEDSLIAIHDAARPCVTKRIINDAYDAAEEYGAAVPVIPVTDTIRTIDGELIDRNTLRAMQTPQTFRFEIVKKAYDALFKQNDFAGVTDDIEVVSRFEGVKAFYAKGSPTNKKITASDDIDNNILNYLLKQ